MKSLKEVTSEYAEAKVYNFRNKNYRLLLWLLIGVLLVIIIKGANAPRLKNEIDCHSVRFLISMALVLISVKPVSFIHEKLHLFAIEAAGAEGYIDMKRANPCCGSDWYFERNTYIVVSLCPFIAIAGTIAIITVFLPETLWIFGFCQLAFHGMGCCSDLLNVIILLRQDKDVLVRDEGTVLHIYKRITK